MPESSYSPPVTITGITGHDAGIGHDETELHFGFEDVTPVTITGITGHDAGMCGHDETEYAQNLLLFNEFNELGVLQGRLFIQIRPQAFSTLVHPSTHDHQSRVLFFAHPSPTPRSPMPSRRYRSASTFTNHSTKSAWRVTEKSRSFLGGMGGQRWVLYGTPGRRIRD
jgi:hypothetical protein